MISGKEPLFEWIELNECPYWTLYMASNTNQKIATSEEREGQSVKDTIARLEKVLDLHNAGVRYYIVIRQQISTTSQAGVFKTYFELPKSGTQQQGAEAPANIAGYPLNGQNIDEVINQRVTAALSEYQLRQELAEAKARIKELEPNLLDNRIGKVMDNLGPYIPSIMESMGMKAAPKAQIAVAGAGTQSQTQTNEQTMTDEQIKKMESLKKMGDDKLDETQKIELAIMLFLKHSDSDFLLKIARSVDNDPGLINKVKLFLD